LLERTVSGRQIRLHVEEVHRKWRVVSGLRRYSVLPLEVTTIASLMDALCAALIVSTGFRAASALVAATSSVTDIARIAQPLLAVLMPSSLSSLNASSED